MSTSPKTTASDRRRAREAQEAQRARFATNQQVLITQVVGSIMPDSNADETMVGAAYSLAAKFIENNANGIDSIDLTWEINGDHFNAQYYPKRDQRPSDFMDQAVPTDY